MELGAEYRRPLVLAHSNLISCALEHQHCCGTLLGRQEWQRHGDNGDIGSRRWRTVVGNAARCVRGQRGVNKNTFSGRYERSYWVEQI